MNRRAPPARTSCLQVNTYHTFYGHLSLHEEEITTHERQCYVASGKYLRVTLRRQDQRKKQDDC